MERSLNMHLPRGWYQVAGVEPPTFRRHGLSTASGTLQISFNAPHDSVVQNGEEALELLRACLAEHHLPKGTLINSGHEACAAGFMAFVAYKQIHGQCEYWLIPNDEANVFAKWQAGANATCGMERHDIHGMLQALHFEDVDEAAPAAEEAPLINERGELVIDPEGLLEGDCGEFYSSEIPAEESLAGDEAAPAEESAWQEKGEEGDEYTAASSRS